MSKRIDLSEIPTRCERAGRPSPTKSEKLREAPDWARVVTCPVCSGKMTIIRVKKDTTFGHNLTYQCHRQYEEKRYCFTIVQIVTGSHFLMRTGDFDDWDYDWRTGVEETVEVRDGDTLVQSTVQSDTDKIVTKTPPTLASRNTRKKVIWDVFFDQIVNYGSAERDDIFSAVASIRPQDKEEPEKSRTLQEISEIPHWLTQRSGFIVNVSGHTYTVVGRKWVSTSEPPFSDSKYRQEFGFNQEELA